MFSEIAGKLYQFDIGILFAQPVHHLPGIVSGAVVHKYDFIFSQFPQDFFFHVLIQEFQCICIVIHWNDN